MASDGEISPSAARVQMHLSESLVLDYTVEETWGILKSIIQKTSFLLNTTAQPVALRGNQVVDVLTVIQLL